MRQVVTVLVLAGCLAGRASDEQVLVVEQEYHIVEQDKEGVSAKDIKQKLYMSEHAIRIDEYAGVGRTPSETFIVDMKEKRILNLDNENLYQTAETFAERRERLEKRKKQMQEDLDNLPDGKQKEKLARLYKAMLDDDRIFETMISAEKDREIAGVRCDSVWVVDGRDREYVPLKAQLHPTLEVPYDTAEVLYLLKIIGAKMKEFLNQNRKHFRRLPMEMELDLAAGGTLHTKVLSFEQVARAKLDKGLFEVPAGYREKPKPLQRPPPEGPTGDPDR